MNRPLVVELFCGRFGWSRGFVAEGYRAVGFDIVHEPYHGNVPEGCSLALQDVLTLHGSQFRDAAVIVASPPCQAYSYMAMPWKLAKAKAAAIRADETGEKLRELTALFDACFRIQREAIEASTCYACDGERFVLRNVKPHNAAPGAFSATAYQCPECKGTGKRYIPMVVENVKGAQPWVGPAKAHFGSFYLWGDVESVGGRITVGRFGQTLRAAKSSKNGSIGGGSWFAIGSPGQQNVSQNPDGRKVPGFNFHEYEKTGQPGRSFQPAAVMLSTEGVKQRGSGAAWFDEALNQRRREATAGMKGNGGGWFEENDSPMRKGNSKSPARKAASALIAEIPLDLARYIARCYKPVRESAA